MIDDYARTDANIGAVLQRLAGIADDERQHIGSIIDSDSPLLRAHAAAMATMLQELDEHHGGLAALLHRNGLTDSTVERLRGRLID